MFRAILGNVTMESLKKNFPKFKFSVNYLILTVDIPLIQKCITLHRNVAYGVCIDNLPVEMRT